MMTLSQTLDKTEITDEENFHLLGLFQAINPLLVYSRTWGMLGLSFNAFVAIVFFHLIQLVELLYLRTCSDWLFTALTAVRETHS